jgi:hypothetical protein
MYSKVLPAGVRQRNIDFSLAPLSPRCQGQLLRQARNEATAQEGFDLANTQVKS